MHSERKISLTMAFPPEHMVLLTKSANSSARAKNKDAAMRLKDHLQRHGDVSVRSRMGMPSRNTRHVTVFLDAACMTLLTQSAKKSLCSKSCEASMRLIDHLERYEYIASVGNVTPRNSGSLQSAAGGMRCR